MDGPAGKAAGVPQLRKRRLPPASPLAGEVLLREVRNLPPAAQQPGGASVLNKGRMHLLLHGAGIHLLR
eukprot:15005324-Heterocapsa_arctica.AAC.1